MQTDWPTNEIPKTRVPLGMVMTKFFVFGSVAI